MMHLILNVAYVQYFNIWNKITVAYKSSSCGLDQKDGSEQACFFLFSFYPNGPYWGTATTNS